MWFKKERPALPNRPRMPHPARRAGKGEANIESEGKGAPPPFKTMDRERAQESRDLRISNFRNDDP
jgi:hypothetical protein